MKLVIDELARDFFLLCMRYRITTSVEWTLKKKNAFAEDISKLLVSEVPMLSRGIFDMLDRKWGPHTLELLSSNAYI